MARCSGLSRVKRRCKADSNILLLEGLCPEGLGLARSAQRYLDSHDLTCVRYRLAFEKRIRSDGKESELDPTIKLDDELSPGIVAEKLFVERLEPEAQHSQEVLDEDDAFLALAGTEVWEYEVLNTRREEFEAAIRNSQVVFEATLIDDSDTAPEDATPIALNYGDPYASKDPSSDEATPDGSGVRATEYDGPAGQPTGDPSAGGSTLRHNRVADDQLEGLEESGGALDDLTVTDGDDPRLGLTDTTTPDHDWAADIGPTRTSGRGVQTRDLADRSSSLRPTGGADAGSPSAPKKQPKSNQSGAGATRKRKG
jgi:hypothetical protein